VTSLVEELSGLRAERTAADDIRDDGEAVARHEFVCGSERVADGKAGQSADRAVSSPGYARTTRSSSPFPAFNHIVFCRLV
jgi:hypothetical protein